MSSISNLKSCPRVPKLLVSLHRSLGRCLKVTLRTCAPTNSTCVDGAEQRVKHAQTREWGPPSVPAEWSFYNKSGWLLTNSFQFKCLLRIARDHLSSYYHVVQCLVSVGALALLSLDVFSNYGAGDPCQQLLDLEYDDCLCFRVGAKRTWHLNSKKF